MLRQEETEIICYKVEGIELQREDAEMVDKVLRHTGMTIEEFAAYAVAQIAESHIDVDGCVSEF